MPERIHVDLLNYQAETFLALHAMNEAYLYLEAAVKAALAIGSERRFQEVLTLFQRMRIIW